MNIMKTRRIIYKIPVGKISIEETKKNISELMSDYHEDVIWDEADNRVKIKDGDDVWIPLCSYMKTNNKDKKFNMY